MSFDPISIIVNNPLSIDNSTLQKLNELQIEFTFNELPGPDEDEEFQKTDEIQRLQSAMNDLLNVLVENILRNPSKLWVLSQFKNTLEIIENEDTEARELFGIYLEKIMSILGIESSDGLLAFYLGT